MLVLLIGSTLLSGRAQQTGIAQLGGALFAGWSYGWWLRPVKKSEGTSGGQKALSARTGFAFAVNVVVVALVLVLMNRTWPKLGERALERSLGAEVRVYRSTHFALYGQGGDPGILEELGRSLDEFYEGFLDRQGKRFSLRPFQKEVSLVLFRDRESLQTWYRMRYGQHADHSAGFYDPARRLIGVARTEDDPIRIAYHECIHMLFDPGGDKRWSRWLSEGLAMVFEEGFLGQSIEAPELPRFLQWRSEGRSGTHMRDLFAASESSFRGPDNTVYYLGSRLLVDFLLHAPSLRVRRRFLESHYQLERSRGPQPVGVVSKIYGMDLEELDQRWLQYLEGLLGEGM